MRDLLCDLLFFLALAIAVVLFCAIASGLSDGAPVPARKRGPSLAAQRARFPDPGTVCERTNWLWRLQARAYRDEQWDWGTPEEARYRYPVYWAWFIWDDVRLYDEAATDQERARLLDRIRRWLGPEAYRRGRLPPARWWEMEIPGKKIPGPRVYPPDCPPGPLPIGR